MKAPQITIEKAYINSDGPTSQSLSHFSVQSVASHVDGLLNPDPSRFTEEPGSGIVYDPLTGLMWAKDETEALDWDAQVKACAALRLGGYGDWSMPSRYAMQTILDLSRHNPCLPTIFNTRCEAVWTSTQTPWTKDKAGSSRSFFCVGMGYGSVADYHAYLQLRARPVRRAAPASQ